MTLKEVQQIAKNMGITPKKMNKTQLIQTIQTQENNTPCFSCGTALAKSLIAYGVKIVLNKVLNKVLKESIN